MLDGDLSDIQLRNKVSKISFEATGKDVGNSERCQIELKTFQKIKFHFQLLELLEKCQSSDNNSIYWKLTNNGKNLIFNSLCILKKINRLCLEYNHNKFIFQSIDLQYYNILILFIHISVAIFLSQFHSHCQQLFSTNISLASCLWEEWFYNQQPILFQKVCLHVEL